jgi:hypothetical protein
VQLGAGRSWAAGRFAGVGHAPHVGPRRLRRGDVARPVRPLPPPDRAARVALRLRLRFTLAPRSPDHSITPPHPIPLRPLGRGLDGAGVFGRCARAGAERRLVLGPPQSPAPPPPRRLRSGAGLARRVHFAHDGYLWSTELYDGRRTRQFGGGAAGAEPSCRAFRAGGEGHGRQPVARGRSWPPGLRRDEHGTPKAARAQRRRAGGLFEVAVRSASGELASLSGAGGTPIPRALPADPGDRRRDDPALVDSRRGPVRRRLRRSECSSGARPKLTSTPGRYVKPGGQGGGGPRDRSENRPILGQRRLQGT